MHADAGQSNSQAGPSNQALFLQKVRESSEAVNSGDFRRAIQLYTEAISLDPSNHILYTNRAAAYAKLHYYDKSLEDAKRAKELNPKWAKVGSQLSPFIVLPLMFVCLASDPYINTQALTFCCSFCQLITITKVSQKLRFS